MNTPELPPLDAGSSAAESLPPLEEVGARSEDDPVTPDTPAEPVETPDPAEPKIDESQDKSGEDKDEDVLNAFLAPDEAAEAKAPDGIDANEWKKFQEWQKAQAQPAAEQPPAESPAEEQAAVEPLTDEEFDRVFDNKDTFQSAIGKAMSKHSQEFQEKVYDEMDKAMQAFGTHLLGRMEQLIYLSDAIKECPEINNYQRAFQVAYAKALENQKPGDLYTPVRTALDTFQREMKRAESIRSTKKVDVRQKQIAPKGANPGPRSIPGSAPQGGDVNNHSFLTGIWRTS